MPFIDSYNKKMKGNDGYIDGYISKSNKNNVCSWKKI